MLKIKKNFWKIWWYLILSAVALVMVFPFICLLYTSITGTTLRVDGGLILPGMPELIDETGADKGWGYTQPKDF